MLKRIVKSVYKKLLTEPLSKIDFFTNKWSNKKECYICKSKFNHFTTYRNGWKGIPKLHRKLNIIGSDPENFRCMYCNVHDRERHLFMFFDKINFWEKFKNNVVLHFAPEKMLASGVEKCLPSKYIKADLFPKDQSIQSIDVTKIPFENETVDVILCNHVLEHVPDYKRAMSEFYRVLKKDGIAILQTPFSTRLIYNFEVKDVNTNADRNFFYRQYDHVRIFSEDVFLNDLRSSGFTLNIIKNSELFNDSICSYYGVNRKEDLIMVIK